MPPLVRKLSIYAGAHGLLIQPGGSRNQSPITPLISIEYKSGTISLSPNSQESEEHTDPLEAHGVIGLLRLASTPYLITISRRDQVAQIHGKPIYVITDVVVIPLSSQKEAQDAITQSRKALQQGKNASSEHDETDDEEEAPATTSTDDAEHDDALAGPTGPPGIAQIQQGVNAARKGTTVISDVIKNRGNYGRIAEKWFSKSGWKASARRQGNADVDEEGHLSREQKRQGLESMPEGSKLDEAPVQPEGDKLEEDREEQTSDEAEATGSTKPRDILQSLTPRILRTVKLFFAANSFYFSYDHDISRSVAKQESSSSSLPLSKRFDPVFFWNHNLVSPFIDAGQHAFVLPVIQGFVGQRAFTISKTEGDQKDKVADAAEKADEVIELQDRKATEAKASSTDPASEDTGSITAHDFLITLVSRRSVNRAGLRYLRRGTDDAGHVANSVETEQILSSQTRDASSKVFSLVQLRGSIPLFYSQSPYSFKPIPIMYGSESTNQTAFNKHFASIQQRYGDVQAVSLIDQHGTEKPIGDAYQHHAELSNNSRTDHKIAFEWFDFHNQCKGMKFENVSILLTTLSSALKAFSWTERSASSSKLLTTQSGVIRTNCMDCLDRTNVTQSAIAGSVLISQLATLGLSIDLKSDPKTQWFNTLWADNGDAISRQYAGTAALKGDFTRTRKRAWTGALSDFSLTLTRYYNNIFSDYFLQTVIDYLLGNGDGQMFVDFETDLMTRDYAVDTKKVREGAVETCVKVILGTGKVSSTTAAEGLSEQHDDEDLVCGWTLGTPAKANTLRELPFEECVLLLTDQAIYAVRFDWNTEKVGSYERIKLEHVRGVKKGTYITSTLGEAHLDEAKNVGFVIRYETSGEEEKRTNTRALGNEGDPPDTSEGVEKKEEEEADIEESAASSKKDDGKDAKQDVKSEMKIIAFKALPPSSTATKTDANSPDVTVHSEKQIVQQVTDEIHRVADLARAKQETEGLPASGLRGTKDEAVGKLKDKLPSTEFEQKSTQDSDGARDSTIIEKENQAEEDQGKQLWTVEEDDIISVADARRSTSYLESIGYSLKKLVWA